MFLFRKKIIIILSSAILPIKILTFAQTPFYKPYDINYRTDLYNFSDEQSDSHYAHLKVGVSSEYGETDKSLNGSAERTSLLSIYHHSESSLAMLQGAQAGSPIKQLANQLNSALIGVTDDGKRGRLKFYGKYSELDFNLYASYWFRVYKIPGHFHVNLYIPFRDKRVKDFHIKDLTKNTLSADILVKELITDNIQGLVKELGDLELSNWHKTGIGDVIFLAGWQHSFVQYRKILKKVRLYARAGVSFPTGAKADINNPFSAPLGNDGSFSFPIDFGIDLYLKNKIKAGLEFEILQLSETTRTRRIKTDRNQTDFLLLNKALTRKKYGDTWRFNLYVQSEHFYRGLSAALIYQFVRNEDDRLILKTHNFNEEIANTAQSLQDWTYQFVALQINYDCGKEVRRFPLRPQISLYYKIPVAGHRFIDMNTVGGQLTFNF